VTWAALLLALALRLALWFPLTGTAWFEEDVPTAWAWRLWGFSTGHFDPNPHSALWPHLSVYFFFAVQAVQYAIGRATGAWSNLAEWNAAVVLEPQRLRAAAMLAAIAIAMATLVATARLVRRAAGEWAAAGVTLVLALDPLFLRHALVVSPDMLLTLFTVLGLLAALDVAERGRRRDSLGLGLWLGLGVACKYSPLLLAAPAILAHAHRPGGRRGWAVLADPRLALAALVSLAAFAATSPFTLIDLVRRGHEFGTGAGVLTSGQVGNARTFAGVEFFGRTLPGDLGWPLFALLGAALAWALVRRTPARLVLASFALVYLAVFALVPTAFERYLMPAYPPTLALGAAALVSLGARSRPAAGTVLALALGGLVLTSARFLDRATRPDTRALAREWFTAHVPDGDVVALEQAGPELPDRLARRDAATRAGVGAPWRARLAAGPAYAIDFVPMSFPDPEIASPFHSLPDYLDFDEVVVSSGVTGRYAGEPARFPREVAFAAGLERFAPVLYRSPGGRVVGPAITVYRTAGLPRATVEAWWSARFRPTGFRNAAEHAFAARVWRDRARTFAACGRDSAALRMWRDAATWPQAPAAWRLAEAGCAARLHDRAACAEALSGLAHAGRLTAAERADSSALAVWLVAPNRNEATGGSLRRSP